MALPLILTGLAFGPVVASVARWVVGYQIARWIAALGIAVLSFSSIDSFVDYVEDFIRDNMESAGAASGLWEIAESLRFPEAVNIVVSCYVAAIGIRKLLGFFNKLTFGKSTS